MNFDVASAALWVFPLLLAVVCHEWAHGYVAYRLGDDTAKRMGRLTLNPVAHIDPVGTLLMPAILFATGAPFLFGYAKPVPIAWNRLGNPARDMVWVAAAGPAMNMILALISAIVAAFALGVLGPGQAESAMGFGATADTSAGFAVATPIAIMAFRSLVLNVVLAVFNLLPIPPLDGGRVAVGLLPRNLAYPLAQVEPYGFFIVFGLLATGVLGTILGPVLGAVVGMFQMLVAGIAGTML